MTLSFNPFGNFLFQDEDVERITDENADAKILPVKCQCCGKEFMISKNTYIDLRDNFNRNRTSLRTCSAKCAKTTFQYKCANCGKVCERTWKTYKVNETDELFCSPACSRQFYKSHDMKRKSCYVAPVEENPNGNFLFTKEEFVESLRPSKIKERVLPCRCVVCNKTFYVSPKLITDQFKQNRLSNNRYCSIQCAGVDKRNRVKTTCANCGKELEVRESLLHDRNFCNRECKYAYERLHPNYVSRSRMELLVEKMLTLAFPNLEVNYNNRELLNGIELDVYIPELRLAIEINGGYHYKVVDGDTKAYERTVKNDTKRRVLCEENGIDLYEYDTSKFAYPSFVSVDNYLRPILLQVLTNMDDVGYKHSNTSVDDIIRQTFDSVIMNK